MREQSASKINLKLKRVLAIVSAFLIGLGAFCAPMTAFADVNTSATKRFVFNYGDYSYYTYSTIDGSSWDSSDFMASTVNIPLDYSLFRVYLKLPEVIPMGANVTVFIKYNLGPGSMTGSGCMWLGNHYGEDVSSQVQYSDIVWSWWDSHETSFSGLVTHGISSDLMFQFSYNRSSSFFFRITEIIVEVESSMYLDDNSQTNAQLGMQNQLTGNILEDIKIIGGNILNLPSMIGNALSNLFNTVVSAVVNLPASIGNALSGLFSSVKSAVDGIASSVFGFFSGFIGDVQGYFEQIIGTTDGGSLDDFSSENADNIANLDSALGSLDSVSKPNTNDLPTLDEFLPTQTNPLYEVLRRFFALDFVKTMSLASLAFGAIGYMLFGKR